jgi:hypothetical protein
VSEEKEIHPAVALLLKRMDSNPQEFISGEWASVEEAIAAYATEEECKLVEEKLGKLWMDHTHETMLKHLFKVDEKDAVQEAAYTKWGNKVIDPLYHLKLHTEYQKHAAQALGNQANTFQYDMEQNVIKHMQGYAPSGESKPKKPYPGQIVPAPRPLSILRGFFKGKA